MFNSKASEASAGAEFQMLAEPVLDCEFGVRRLQHFAGGVITVLEPTGDVVDGLAGQAQQVLADLDRGKRRFLKLQHITRPP